ncbi:MAG TPA: hypothetical protein VHG72_15210, partial [Polyangia bacterium]|nr:hypothetical protein [Polyangia bacterium]
KNVQGSGSRWDRGSDGIVGLIYGDAVVLRDGGDVFACSVAAHDDADRDSGLGDDQTAERQSRVDHDDLWFFALASNEREKSGRQAVRVVLDAGQRRSERALHLGLALAGCVDELPEFLDEQVHAIRLELRRDQRPRQVHATFDESESSAHSLQRDAVMTPDRTQDMRLYQVLEG